MTPRTTTSPKNLSDSPSTYETPKLGKETTSTTSWMHTWINFDMCWQTTTLLPLRHHRGGDAQVAHHQSIHTMQAQVSHVIIFETNATTTIMLVIYIIMKGNRTPRNKCMKTDIHHASDEDHTMPNLHELKRRPRDERPQGQASVQTSRRPQIGRAHV